MAKRVVVVTEDDLDGTEGAQTVKFGLDGVTYEIDLSEKNAKALRGTLSKYTAVARKSKRPYTRRNKNTTKLEVAS